MHLAQWQAIFVNKNCAFNTLYIQLFINFQEIIVGILANISCQEDIVQQIVADSELLALMFGLLSNKDSQTVIQCIRLLETLLASPENEKVMKITASVIIWNDLSFILQNSLNGNYILFHLKSLQYLIIEIDCMIIPFIQS